MTEIKSVLSEIWRHIPMFLTTRLPLGGIGAAIAAWFGGWDSTMDALAICMIIDYASGVVIAGFFKKSSKTENGKLNSHAGWKGLLKKGMTLAVVLVAAQVGIITQTPIIKDAVVIAFISNEALSILENAGKMGVPIPAVIANAIDALQQKGGKM